MRLRLEPSDEYMHPLEEATNFNESMYFNFYDHKENLGGFLRLGNRANEGYAEMTTCLYLLMVEWLLLTIDPRLLITMLFRPEA